MDNYLHGLNVPGWYIGLFVLGLNELDRHVRCLFCFGENDLQVNASNAYQTCDEIAERDGIVIDGQTQLRGIKFQVAQNRNVTLTRTSVFELPFPSTDDIGPILREKGYNFEV